jgi:hypothetical protein
MHGTTIKIKIKIKKNHQKGICALGILQLDQVL